MTVAITGDTGTDLTLSTTSLTFTRDDWDTPQRVKVTAASDTDMVDDMATLTHTPSGGDHENLPAATLAMTVLEVDDRGITAAPTTVTTECPTDNGTRIILERTGEIGQAGETDFWKVDLDPWRVYIIEVLGANSGLDVVGVDSYQGNLTLADPRMVGVWNSERDTRLIGTGDLYHDWGTGRNDLAVVKLSRSTPYYVEVASGDGGTGTYQIKVRVNNVCGGGHYPWFGGPDGYDELDVPADTRTGRTLYTAPGLINHPSGQGGFLGDNWDWDKVPDEDWYRIELTQGYEYTVELWTSATYPEKHQATQLKSWESTTGTARRSMTRAAPAAGNG